MTPASYLRGSAGAADRWGLDFIKFDIDTFGMLLLLTMGLWTSFLKIMTVREGCYNSI